MEDFQINGYYIAPQTGMIVKCLKETTYYFTGIVIESGDTHRRIGDISTDFAKYNFEQIEYYEK